jgi:predicted phosphodiesterase
MKIAICSDVHLEFGQLELENTQNAEVLVLSGDICTACDLRVTDSILSSAKTDRYLDFFTACSRNFPHVVYVMGNHEHYHGDYATSAGILRDAMKQCGDNIHFLDKEVWEHQDHVFIGGTLWTDMNGEDENDHATCLSSYE